MAPKKWSTKRWKETPDGIVKLPQSPAAGRKDLHLNFATAFSDVVLAVASFNAAFRVKDASLFAVGSFLMISTAAVLGVVRFSVGHFLLQHRWASQTAGSLGMSLLLAAYLDLYGFQNTPLVSILTLGILITLFPTSPIGTQADNFSASCIILIAALNIYFEWSFDVITLSAVGLYTVAGFVLNRDSILRLSTIDWFHYILSLANILFSISLKVLGEKHRSI